MRKAFIEIEARPPGKKVKRLSLLSGGERSLTAIAYLFAIFRARPSPFYVLDEVEAALDDTNLQRLLGVFEAPRRLQNIGVPEDALAEATAHAMDDWAIIAGPRVPDTQDVRDLLQGAW